MLVSLKHAFKPITLWVKDIAIERKAMRSFVTIRDPSSELSTEPEAWELLVSIIELKDISNRFKSLVIFVISHIEVMERIPLCWWAITQSKINCNGKIQFAPSKDILQETVSLLNQHFVERKLSILLLSHEEFNFTILWIFKLINCE